MSLLYSIIRSADRKTLFQLKDEFFPTEERKTVKFVRQYVLEHKTFPEITLIEAKFETAFEPSDAPVEYWFKEAQKKYQELLIMEAAKSALKGKSIEPMQKAVLDYFAGQDSQHKFYSDEAQKRFDRYENTKLQDGFSYLPIGWSELDGLVFGLRETDYWLLGGEEGLGKTWLLVRLACFMLRKLHLFTERPLLFFQGEMTNDEMYDRFDSVQAGISYKKLITGDLKKMNEVSYKTHLTKLAESENKNLLVIDDCFDLETMLAYITAYNPAAVIVDGIHLYSKSFDWKDLMKTSVDLKKYSRQQKIPIIATTHLNNPPTTEEKATKGSFAYFKGARDPDVAMVMFQNDIMKIHREIGLKIVKGRQHGEGCLYYAINHATSEFTTNEVIKY